MCCWIFSVKHRVFVGLFVFKHGAWLWLNMKFFISNGCHWSLFIFVRCLFFFFFFSFLFYCRTALFVVQLKKSCPVLTYLSSPSSVSQCMIYVFCEIASVWVRNSTALNSCKGFALLEWECQKNLVNRLWPWPWSVADFTGFPEKTGW